MTPEKRAGIERPAEQLLLGVMPVALTVWLALSAIRLHSVAQDFSLAYYPAAHRLLLGGNPYSVTHGAVIAGAAFVYPALSAVVLAPFALVGVGLSDHLYTLLCFVLVPGTLWTLQVRDWRVYGVSLLWYPVIIGWQGENISVLLAFLVALAWRHRDRPVVAGLVVAAAVSLKPIVWPLGLWLLVTRRWRASGWALLFGIVLNLVAWSIVGLGELHTYLHLSAVDTDALWRGGYSLLAAAHHLGFGRSVGEAALLGAAAAVALMLLDAGLRRRSDRETMVLAVALMLIASPLLWIHYFVLLLVPLAICRPRFCALWAVPLAMWLLPPATTVDGWQLALAWVVVGSCLIGALRGSRDGGGRPATVIAGPVALELSCRHLEGSQIPGAVGGRMLD